MREDESGKGDEKLSAKFKALQSENDKNLQDIEHLN
jgi:hypothetical protein